MDSIPGMNDTAIIITIIVALFVGAIICAVCLIKGTKNHLVAFEKNSDLRQFHERNLFLISRKERSAWFAGIVVTLVLTALFSWTSQRDEAEAAAEHAGAAANDRLAHLIATTRCAPPAAPLEKLVMSVGVEADGKRPAIACVYITSSLNTIPKLRFARAIITASGNE